MLAQQSKQIFLAALDGLVSSPLMKKLLADYSKYRQIENNYRTKTSEDKSNLHGGQ